MSEFLRNNSKQTKEIVSVFKQIKMSEEITKIVAKSLFTIYFFLKYDHKTVRSQLLRQAKSLHLSHLVSFLSLLKVSQFQKQIVKLCFQKTNQFTTMRHVFVRFLEEIEVIKKTFRN